MAEHTSGKGDSVVVSTIFLVLYLQHGQKKNLAHSPALTKTKENAIPLHCLKKYLAEKGARIGVRQEGHI